MAATAIGCASLALGLAVAPAAFADVPMPQPPQSSFTWNEGDLGTPADAGSDLPHAQRVQGDGPLGTITGHIGGAEDMYRICLTGADFSMVAATTTDDPGDPALWLFDASGDLVTSAHGAGVDAQLTAPAAGAYFVAIAPDGDDPLTDGGAPMLTPGSGPLRSWSGGTVTPDWIFDYEISLTGAEACPPPDTTAPTVALTTPPEGATYLLGQSVAADYACTDGAALVDCVGTVADGSAIDTASVGTKQFTVTAHDAAGNETVVTHHYDVAYAFNGFLAPISGGNVFNVLKAGQSVPVKFSLGGDQGLGILAAGSPSSRPMDCDTTALADPVDQIAAAGASGLSYDAPTDTYTYVWKTEKRWAGTCRELTVTLVDGTSHTARFSLTR